VRFDPKKKPGLSNLLEIFSSFDGVTPQEVATRYERYGDLKKDLAELVIESLAPIKARYLELRADPLTRTGDCSRHQEGHRDRRARVSTRAAAMGLI